MDDRRVRQPRPLLERPIRMDMKGVFLCLAKAVGHGVTNNWGDFIAEAIDGLALVRLELSPGERAWLLLRRAMTRALFDLIADSGPLQVEKELDLDAISKGIDRALASDEFTLESDFFETAGELEFLSAVRRKLNSWLTNLNVPECERQNILGRLPKYFLLSLHEEWRSNYEYYAPIQEITDNPFLAAEEGERRWASYVHWLQVETERSLFGESFGLRSVYTPPRAYFFRVKKNANQGERRSTVDRKEKVVVDLTEALDAWLEDDDRRNAIQVISGGPGSGKSSFARMYSARIAARGRKVVLAPLHLLDPRGDLVDALNAFCRDSELLPDNLLPHVKSQLLLVFDGLDELSKQGQVGAEVAREFVREVERSTSNLNQSSYRIRVLLSGRPVTIDANEAEFRRPGQVLHLLPYNVKEIDHFEDPQKLVAYDFRDDWWQKYGEAKGKDYKGLPTQLKRDDLAEVTAWPLLNYLLALSYDRQKIDFSRVAELNVLFEDLLEAVHERAYATGRHPAVECLSFEQFRRALEEIAVTAWQGDGRTTTVASIEKRCKNSGVINLLETFEQSARKGIARLLTAFYFRQLGAGVEGERTYEFTHKSFMEYLAAMRIIGVFERICNQITLRESNVDEGWSEMDALVYWVEICGARRLDQEIASFIDNETRLRDRKTVEAWQRICVRLMERAIGEAMPMERIGQLPFSEARRQARNAEEALLVFHAACAQTTKKVSEIDWPTEDSAGNWLGRLVGQRSGEQACITVRSLNHLRLSGCVLRGRDLFGANLFSSQLSGADLHNAILDEADLGEVDLSKADLSNASLFAAELDHATLVSTNFVGADLTGANLSNANVDGAFFNKARLSSEQLGKVRGEPKIMPSGRPYE